MTAITIRHPAIDKIMEGLGIQDIQKVTSFEIVAEIQEPVRVTVKYLMDDTQAEDLQETLKNYMLTEMIQEDNK